MENEHEIKEHRYFKKRFIIPATVVLLFVFIGVYMFINSLYYQSTDDAFIEGRLISIAPRVSGQVVSLNVDDNDYVKEGDLLLEIDPHDYENKVKELEGALREAKANKNVSSDNIEHSSANLADADKNLDFAKKDFIRYSKLRENGLCTKQQYDAAETAYKQAAEKRTAMNAGLKSSRSKDNAANANIDKIEAQLAQAKLNLSYTKIYAPQDGFISARSVEKGNYVNVAQPLMAVVSPKIWIVANFKETQLTNMKKGQRVSIKIDTYPNKRFQGVVDSIQLASGAKTSLFPPENAVGSYIKVVQRIPVKIIFDEDISQYKIAPGMSVVPKVKIR
ncbi:MAG: HlyD family secretion protein [Candidatus Gastranaerophilales bacterium]|nr:HlyD family secretion protein [Candidatus Gastranaerophilales bacterium]